jgi:hypothetical protein
MATYLIWVAGLAQRAIARRNARLPPAAAAIIGVRPWPTAINR